MATAPAVHTDDTGWRVSGQTAFLMGFDSDQATVYQIRSRHRHEEVLEVVPAHYAGVLVNDRGKSYDARELVGLRQQKCLAHLLRNVSEVVERKWSFVGVMSPRSVRKTIIAARDRHR